MLTPEFFSEIKEWQLDHLAYEVMWISESGEIVFANKAWCEQLNYAKNELNGMKIFDVNPRLTEKKWKTHWQEVAKKGVVNFTTIHQRKGGILYDVEVSAQFFSNNRKNVICAMVHEITQSTFYKQILDTSESLVKMGGWSMNLQDNSIIVTNEVLRIFETEESEEIRPINAIKYFKDPERFQELIAASIAKARPFDETLSVKDAKGQEKWLRCAGLPVLVNEQVKKVIGVYQDVSDQHTNLLSLRLFKEIIDQSEDIVFVWKENGELLDFSESALKQLRYKAGELESATIYQVDPNVDEQWWFSHFEDIKRRKNFRMEWKATRKDGSQFPVDISVNHLYFQGEHLNCAILRDISERKQSESDLRMAFEEIRSLKDQLEIENEYLQQELRVNQSDIICQSEAYEKVLKQVEQVAPTDTTVLITGESGTGKELLAKALHQNSQRKDHALVKVNCATLPKDLFESELFGHKKGSFTGAIADKEGKFKIADGGTIFLDEIGEIPVEMQAKLLRVLQEGEFDMVGGEKTMRVDVRIIAATNRDLEKMVQEGNFREDLFYRLNVFPIHNIALRERKEDIPLLAHAFLQKYSAKAGKSFQRVSKKTLDALAKYDFPGNIRELENLIERAVITEQGNTLFPGEWIPNQKAGVISGSVDWKSFEQMQKDYIIKVLEKTNGRVSGVNGAATILQMNDKTLFAKMKKLGIEKKVVIKS
ncbi:MAG: sigma 54-interacting transcriptional regulator [Cytophagales bacterium]|nr:sigma 54-interacting transcriptional regulator [Cytophagales bacterium]